jgi:ADP-ribose pyrophosphatase YjhB (NUDIX family)
MRATSEYERKLDAPIGFRLPPLGGSPLEPRVFSPHPEMPNIVAGFDGGHAGRHLVLNGHIDVFPVAKHEWTRDPWGGEIVDGRIYGRGACDMKCGLASITLAFLHLHAMRDRLKGRLTYTAVSDEETFGPWDARRVLDRFVEVEVEPPEGSPMQLDALADELAEAGAEPGAGTPKVFRALNGGPVKSPAPQTPFEALRDRLCEQLREIERHDPGTRLGRDPESLHDMRVGVRRLRALLRAGKELVATDTTELDARLKQLGSVLGDVRDLDVLLERLEGEGSRARREDARRARSLFDALRTGRKRCRRRLMTFLRSAPATSRYSTTPLGRSEARGRGESDASLDQLADKAFSKAARPCKLPDEPADEERMRCARRASTPGTQVSLPGAGEVRGSRPEVLPGTFSASTAGCGRRCGAAAGAGRAGDARQALAAGRLIPAGGTVAPRPGGVAEERGRSSRDAVTVRAAGVSSCAATARCCSCTGREVRRLDVPQGKCDPGESDEACALREVEEETGLRCELRRLREDELPRREGPTESRSLLAHARAGRAFVPTTRWTTSAGRSRTGRRVCSAGIATCRCWRSCDERLLRHASAGHRTRWDGHDVRTLDDRGRAGRGGSSGELLRRSAFAGSSRARTSGASRRSSRSPPPSACPWRRTNASPKARTAARASC